ncbi:MAG: sialidase family protein [Acidobacteriota bacterium]|nr:glycoside hydrolase [Blastocatellia bacterium]MDW8411726.1 sialidase family protein [Acidobacteriota bacterium]
MRATNILCSKRQFLCLAATLTLVVPQLAFSEDRRLVGRAGQKLIPLPAAKLQQSYRSILHPQSDPHLSWLLNRRDFHKLSSAAKLYLRGTSTLASTTTPAASPTSSENIRINNPELDREDRTQSGTTAAAHGARIVVSFNNSAGIAIKNLSGYAYSRDSGQTWKQGFIPTYEGGANLGSGVVTVTRDGTFLHACVARNADGLVSIAVSRSRDGGQTWSAPVNASTTATAKNAFQDKPWITADTSDESFNLNRVFVVWTTILASSGKTRIMLARSKNGRSFKKPQIIAESAEGKFVQGAAVATGPKGEIYIVWLEGEFGRSQLKLAKSIDGGKSFGGPTTIAGFINPAFPANGIFDANSFPSLAVDTSRRSSRGYVYVVYAARPDNRADRSDVYLLRSTDGGNTWNKPLRLNDDPGLAEQMLPSVAVADDGSVAASWYDRRNDPVNLSLLDIYATASTDGGNTWARNKRITDTNWPLVPTPFNLRSGYHGDYHQLGVAGRHFIFTWGDDRNGADSDVYAALRTAAELTKNEPDFLLAASTSYRIALPGNTVTYTVDLSSINQYDLTGMVFSATSNQPGVKLRISDKIAGLRPTLLLEVEVDRNATPGAYFLTITGSKDGRKRSTCTRLTVLANSPYLQPPVNVTSNPSGSILGKSAIQPDGSINIVWFDDAIGLYSMYFTRSTDGGRTFSPANMFPRNLDTFIGTPAIVANENTIYIAYLELFEQPEFVLKTMITRSTDGGNTFSQPTPITEDRNLLIVNESFQMDADGSLHFGATTLQPVNGLYEVYDLKSTDGGRSFIPQRIYSSAAALSIPIVVIDGDGRTVRSIFVDFDRKRGGLFFSRSTDGGKSFSPVTRIPADTSKLLFATAWFGADRTDAVYIEGDLSKEQFAVYYSGATADDNFSEAIKISDDTSTALSASIATKGNTVVIAFEGSQSKYSAEDYFSQVYWCSSTDSGKTFSKPAAFTAERGGDFDPLVLLDLTGEMAIVYSGYRNGSLDLLYSPSFNEGQSFSKPLNLTENAGASGYSDFAYTHDGRIQVLFIDNTSGSFDIYRTILGKSAKSFETE